MIIRIIVLLLMILNVNMAYAGYYKDESNTNKQKQGQIQGQGQNQKAYGGSSYQGQGQIGINKGATGNSETNVSNREDTEVLAPTWAPTPSTTGKEEGKIYTLWGGIDSNELSRDARVDHHIKTLILFFKEGIITEGEYRAEMREVYIRLKQQNKSKRTLGILWKTEGRHIGNCLGLCATDDMKPVLKKLFESVKLKKPSGDDEITGNAGFVN